MSSDAAPSEYMLLSENNEIKEFGKDYVNPRGIIRAENVEAYVAKEGGNPDEVVGRLQEQHGKFKNMEMRLTQRKDVLQNKLPEIKKTLQLIEFLKQKQSEGQDKATTHYQIADNVLAEAEVDISGRAGLWLGANVMVEYSYDEAFELLQRNLKSVVEQLNELNEDLSFLRDQLTTTEVNLSRTYNFGVKLRRDKKAVTSTGAQGSGKGGRG